MRPLEYSEEQTKAMLGHILFPMFEKWMRGQTVVVRDGQEFYHSRDIDNFIAVAQSIIEGK